MQLPPDELKKYLNEQLSKPCILSCFERVDSTNNFLLSQPSSSKIQICTSTTQYAGRGQYGRTWQSDNNSSLLFSIKYQFSRQGLGGISLVVGLAIVAALKKQLGNAQLMLKWPNDVYYKQQKIAGILVENQAQSEYNNVVIGVGINYRLPKNMGAGTTITSLVDIEQNIAPMPVVLAAVIKQILADISDFKEQGFAYFVPRWQRLDYLRNATISLDNGYNYQAQGVAKDGALLLKSAHGTIKRLYRSKAIVAITKVSKK